MLIESFSKFAKYVADDAKQKNIRIIRFINVESLDLWLRVKSHLIEKCPKCLMLSKYCVKNDLMPNIDLLLKDLKNIDRNTILLPLSEYLRIEKDAAQYIISKIMSLEFIDDVQTDNIRLYVPVYKMKNILSKFIEADNRLQENIVFLGQASDDDYSLTIMSKDIGTKIKGNNITGIQKYFEYWEDKPNKPIILHTDNAEYYKDSIFVDNVKVLVNEFDIIEYYNLIDKRICKEWGQNWEWKKLLVILKDVEKIESIFEKIFKLDKYNPALLFSKWKDFTDFEKWLVWLWSKLDAKEGYLFHVIQISSNSSDFIPSLIEHILDMDYKDKDYKKLFAQRKEMLKSLNLEKLSSNFWEKYNQLSYEERLYRLTDSTTREKNEFISLLSKIDISAKNKEIINRAYPDLYAYLNDFIFVDNNLTQYFAEYKVFKLINSYSEEFVSEVTAIASNKGTWWNMKTRSNLVSENYNNKTLIFWVDCLSIDGLGFIQAILKNKYKSIFTNFNVGYVNLPTITEVNKDFLANRKFKVYRALDELKHKGEYPEYIVNEIDMTLDIIKKAIAELENYDKVIITSDHGSSRGAVLNKDVTYKAKDTAQIKRLGRYCVDKHKYEKEIASCIDDGDYHIFASYEHFSIGGNIKGEIHGGATLEEVLVPVIILSKTFIGEKVKIELLTPEIKQQEGIVRFKVDKKYDVLYANVDLKRYTCYREEDYWCFKPDFDKKEEYTAYITSKGSIGEIKYKIIKGRVDNKNFDI
jgi:hypothetical protein